MAQTGMSGIFPGGRPPGRVSSEKNSMLGTTHNARRAPLGQTSGARLIMGEYGNGPYGPGFMECRHGFGIARLLQLRRALMCSAWAPARPITRASQSLVAECRAPALIRRAGA